MARSLRIRCLSAVLGTLLVLSGIVVLATQAFSSPNLPPVTPRELIASVVRAAEAPPPISGEVSVRFSLGLPSLPAEVSGPANGPATFLAYLTGAHRLRVWRSVDGVRVAELMSAGERALFVNRSDAWAWDSRTFTAYHLGPFPASALLRGTGYSAGGLAPLGLADPERLAQLSLQAVSPYAAVSVGPSLRVAGRDAYSLVLAPRTPDTLVGRIVISVDAKQRVPLGVEVFPRGSGKAAISAAFTAVSFAPIARSTFDFTPPRGAKVERPCHLRPGESSEGGIGEPGVAFAPGRLPRVFGTGWSTILALPLPSSADLSRASGEARSILASLLPFSGTLLSARLVDRGDHQWFLVGAVPQSALAKVQTELS